MNVLFYDSVGNLAYGEFEEIFIQESTNDSKVFLAGRLHCGTTRAISVCESKEEAENQFSRIICGYAYDNDDFYLGCPEKWTREIFIEKCEKMLDDDDI